MSNKFNPYEHVSKFRPSFEDPAREFSTRNSFFLKCKAMLFVAAEKIVELINPNLYEEPD